MKGFPVLVVLGALALAACGEKARVWEYKVVAVHAEGHDRTGRPAMKFASVTPAETDLDVLGKDGWELASSYLEVETAYPNFGNDSYVTGLQPNVRPQRLVMLFKRIQLKPPSAPSAK